MRLFGPFISLNLSWMRLITPSSSPPSKRIGINLRSTGENSLKPFVSSYPKPDSMPSDKLTPSLTPRPPAKSASMTLPRLTTCAELVTLRQASALRSSTTQPSWVSGEARQTMLRLLSINSRLTSTILPPHTPTTMLSAQWWRSAGACDHVDLSSYLGI